MTHTPGPWTANVEGAHGNHAGGFSVETTVDGGGLFVICGRAGAPTRAVESHANARLIAAAPELLEALRAAEQFLTPEIDRGHAINGWQNTVDMVRAALSKAMSQK